MSIIIYLSLLLSLLFSFFSFFTTGITNYQRQSDWVAFFISGEADITTSGSDVPLPKCDSNLSGIKKF